MSAWANEFQIANMTIEIPSTVSMNVLTSKSVITRAVVVEVFDYETGSTEEFGNWDPKAFQVNLKSWLKTKESEDNWFSTAQSRFIEKSLRLQAQGFRFDHFKGYTQGTIRQFEKLLSFDTLYLSRFTPEDVGFERTIYLSDKQRYYVVTFSSGDIDSLFHKELNEYFEPSIYGVGSLRWKSAGLAELYRQFRNGRFRNSIIKQLYDISTSIFVSTKIEYNGLEFQS